MSYVCFALNNTYNQTIGNIPTNVATGSTCAISPLRRFHFWKFLYFNSDHSSLPSESIEESGRIVGISENVGHDATFSILNTDTNKVVSSSNVRAADEPTSPNLRIDPLTAPGVVASRHLPSVKLKNDEEASTITKEEAHNASTSSPKHAMPILDPHDLVRRTFLIP